jgi:CRISPR/Cas system-associated exonuclease Cas4 (RecB family)
MRVIRASEIGEYVFCARAWWLRRVAGLEPAGRQRRSQGIRRHRRHGQMLGASRILLLLAGLLFLLALLALLLAL